MQTPNNPNEKCGWCGMIHVSLCPRIKAIEYEGGLIKRVEFHDQNHFRGRGNPALSTIPPRAATCGPTPPDGIPHN
jgi:hypothetical protein